MTGNLEGNITDQEFRPLPGVNIMVHGSSLQGTRGGITDQNGCFRILSLPVGVYTLHARHVAYRSKEFQNVAVSLGKTTKINGTLNPEPVQMPEVVVLAVKPMIDPVSTVQGGNLTSLAIEQLPVERDYRNAAAFLPQANVSYYGDGLNMAGATGLENKYIVNGTDVTDPFRGATGTSLPYNFIQEIEVKTGGYQAEDRGALGGIINVITYSGSNKFQGQLFGFFANNRFAGEARQPMLQPAKGDFIQYDFGLRLGGPIIKDRLWFFAAYNPKREQEMVHLPGIGFNDDISTTHSFAGKINWQAGHNNSCIFTILGDPQSRNAVGSTWGTFSTPAGFVNADPYLQKISKGGTMMTFTSKHIFNNKILETQVSRLWHKEDNIPATARGYLEKLYIDENNNWSGGVPSSIVAHSTVTTFALKGSWSASSHLFKAGVEFCDNMLDDSYGNQGGGVIQNLGGGQYFTLNFQARGLVHNRLASCFIQDRWQLTPRMNFQAGLRWSGEYFIASTGRLAQSITNEFQPRFGLAILPGEPGKKKFFISLGRFYKELSTYLSNICYIEGAVTDIKYYSHDPRIDPGNPDNAIKIITHIRPALKNLDGQYYDGIALGYEQNIKDRIKLSLTGAVNRLEETIEDGNDPESGDYWIANPGKGVLKAYPAVKRIYQALELTLEKPYNGSTGFRASYVLSRTYGNYPGLYNSDYNYSFPNANGSYDQLEIMPNSTGLLPNDRTHVFKFSGSVHLMKKFQSGVFLCWQSGTPLNELGGSVVGPPWNRFMVTRGTAGRTPAIWDINLRFSYLFNHTKIKPKLIMDIFHLFSRRTPVNFEQIHYYNLDENGANINPNPLYGRASRYQPPMTLRLGMETNF